MACILSFIQALLPYTFFLKRWLEHENRTYFTACSVEELNPKDFILGFTLKIDQEVRAGNGGQAGLLCQLNHMHHTQEI
jgi:hypothetical protein